MLSAKKSFVLVIDVQEGFAHTMHDQHYLNSIICTIKVAHLMGLPVIATEQAPEKLGATVSEVEEAGIDHKIQKQTFSCYSHPDFVATIESLNRKQVIISGIEAHGCVWQTVHDLLGEKYQVFLVVDAISAHNSLNKIIALRRCEREGAILTTVEMMATELLRTAEHPQFKEVIKMLKECFRKEKGGGYDQ